MDDFSLPKWIPKAIFISGSFLGFIISSTWNDGKVPKMLIYTRTFPWSPSTGPLTWKRKTRNYFSFFSWYHKIFFKQPCHVTNRKKLFVLQLHQKVVRVLPLLPRNNFYCIQKVETLVYFQMIIRICKASRSVLGRTAVRCQIETLSASTMTEGGILMNTLAHMKPFLAHWVPKGQQVIIKANNGNSRQPSK